MRATFMYGAGDVRVVDVPDPSVKEPTDAVVRVVRACVRVGPAPVPLDGCFCRRELDGA